jgi:hypothetical protein
MSKKMAEQAFQKIDMTHWMRTGIFADFGRTVNDLTGLSPLTIEALKGFNIR